MAQGGIDLYDNPAWVGRSPRYLPRGRGTGVLIGSRYLLIAAHRVNRSASVGVSPGGDGNSTLPLGRAGVKTIRRLSHTAPARPAAGWPDLAQRRFRDP